MSDTSGNAGQADHTATVALQERIDWMVDEDPLKVRDALYAVLQCLDAAVEEAAGQMAAGDYRLCPPDMLRIYCHDAIVGVLDGRALNAKAPPPPANG